MRTRTGGYRGENDSALSGSRSWASWLGEIPWTAFATLTFEDPPDPYRAKAVAEDWISELESAVFRNLPYVLVIESVPRVHVHGLLALPQDRSIERIEALWKRGLTHVHEAPGSHAVSYVAGKLAVEELILLPSNFRARNRRLQQRRKHMARRNSDGIVLQQ